MALAQRGLDIIGMGGKDSFRDSDKKNIHPDIAAIVRDCTVVNLILLLDADTLEVKWDPASVEESERTKDLAGHFYKFKSTVINFREVAKANLGLKDCYFSHLKLNNIENLPEDKKAKGLDDLYELKVREGIEHSFVTNDLLRLAASKAYFDTYNVGAMTPGAIACIFFLNFHRGVPSKFYATYSHILKDHEFKFSNATFQFSADEGLKVIKQADSDKFIRVECDYYKMIEIPDANGENQPNLVPWKRPIIELDYGKCLLKGITPYDAFCQCAQQYRRASKGDQRLL